MNTKTDAGKIKLSFGDPQFFVNEKKRTVTCKIPTYFRVPPELDMFLNVGFCRIEVIGTSICYPSDAWDETLGRHLAESKARKLAYQKARNEVAEFTRKLIPMFRSLVNFTDDMSRYTGYEIDHLRNLSDTVKSIL